MKTFKYIFYFYRPLRKTVLEKNGGYINPSEPTEFVFDNHSSDDFDENGSEDSPMLSRKLHKHNRFRSQNMNTFREKGR